MKSVFDEIYACEEQQKLLEKVLDDEKHSKVVLSSSDMYAKEINEFRPQSSPKWFILQLEVLERLHIAYENQEIKKTILSYYLKETRESRMKLLHWMGSDMAEEFESDIDLPEVPLRLAKIAKGLEILADKGFVGTDRFNTFMNHVKTPLVLRTREVKQYEPDEMTSFGGKRDVCRLRYTSEKTFSRMTDMSGL